MRVLGLAKYGSRAASTRQRLLQYAPYLRENGVELEIRPLLDDAYVGRLMNGERQQPLAIAGAYVRRLRDVLAARRFDAIWLQYEAFPYLPGLAERIVGLLGVPLVYDIDDAIFHAYDHHRLAIVRATLGTKLVPILHTASACLCGNGYLQAYVRQYCENSIVVPTVVDTDVYRPASASRSTPVVGWIGSPTTWAYVEPLLPMLLPLFAKHDATFRVVGAGKRARGIPGIDAVDWEEAREVSDIQKMDIGIMPLTDDPWARGKCGYKVIQYMACGLPAVASPVGVNDEIVTDGMNGFLASSPEDWVASLERLLGDAALRRRLGANGLEIARARYSLRSQRDKVLATLRTVAGERA